MLLTTSDWIMVERVRSTNVGAAAPGESGSGVGGGASPQAVAKVNEKATIASHSLRREGRSGNNTTTRRLY